MGCANTDIVCTLYTRLESIKDTEDTYVHTHTYIIQTDWLASFESFLYIKLFILFWLVSGIVSQISKLKRVIVQNERWVISMQRV